MYSPLIVYSGGVFRPPTPFPGEGWGGGRQTQRFRPEQPSKLGFTRGSGQFNGQRLHPLQAGHGAGGNLHVGRLRVLRQAAGQPGLLNGGPMPATQRADPGT